MGHYSYLKIDQFNLSWKYHVPNFLASLFSEEHFYKIKELEWEKEYYFEYGYKTNVQNSLEILGENGYTKELFVELYQFFYDKLFLEYKEWAKEKIGEQLYHYNEDNNFELSKKLIKSLNNLDGEIKEEDIENKFEEYINSFTELSREEEIEDFIKFLSALLANEKSYIELNDGNKYEIKGELNLKERRGHHFIDFEELHVYLLDKCLELPPWILIISNIFEEHYFMEYQEIISIMYIRLLLEISPNDKEVCLRLDDIIEKIEDAKEIHSELENTLINKINLYNKFFNNLLKNEEHIREKYIKSKTRELLSECLEEEDKYKKGKVLEELIEKLFTSNNQLDLVDKRVKTGDEEIDLVIRNNIDRPFWLSFNSPMFLVECKNWGKKIGTSEVRDFEGKLRNHSTMAKIGFFVSVNGFTSEVKNELKRAERDKIKIVLLNYDDLEKYLYSNLNLFEWLEDKAAILY